MADRILCSVPNCSKSARKRGWCEAHYQRWQKYGDPTKGRVLNGEQHRWLQDNVECQQDECLIWPYSTARGYGYCHMNGKYISVSRWMCEQRNGPPPSPKHEAAHLCGKGHQGCVNPGHLEWKTSAENKADQLIHGTRMRGTRSPHAKLTETCVRSIRCKAQTGLHTYAEIAAQHGVKISSIYKIVSRQNWRWLE